MSKANPKPPPNGRRIVSKDWIKDFFESIRSSKGKCFINIERCDGYPDILYGCSTVCEVFRQIKVRGREHTSRIQIGCIIYKKSSYESDLKDEFVTVWEGNEEMKQLRALYEL